MHSKQNVYYRMEATLSDEFKRSWLTSLIGIALFIGGVWLLTWNEVHTLTPIKTNEVNLNKQ